MAVRTEEEIRAKLRASQEQLAWNKARAEQLQEEVDRPAKKSEKGPANQSADDDLAATAESSLFLQAQIAILGWVLGEEE